MEKAGLFNQFVFLEYFIPSTNQHPRRVDIAIAGTDAKGDENLVLCELKQWQACEMQESIDSNKIRIKVNKKLIEVLHPSVQLDNYENQMKDVLAKCGQDESFLKMHSFVYFHNENYLPKQKQDVLYAEKFREKTDTTKIYTRKFDRKIIKLLKEKVGAGNGLMVARKLQYLQGKYLQLLQNY